MQGKPLYGDDVQLSVHFVVLTFFLVVITSSVSTFALVYNSFFLSSSRCACEQERLARGMTWALMWTSGCAGKCYDHFVVDWKLNKLNIKMTVKEKDTNWFHQVVHFQIFIVQQQNNIWTEVIYRMILI